MRLLDAIKGRVIQFGIQNKLFGKKASEVKKVGLVLAGLWLFFIIPEVLIKEYYLNPLLYIDIIYSFVFWTSFVFCAAFLMPYSRSRKTIWPEILLGALVWAGVLVLNKISLPTTSIFIFQMMCFLSLALFVVWQSSLIQKRVKDGSITLQR